MKILRNVYMTIANTTASHYRAAPFSRLMRALPHRLDFLRHEPIAAAFHTAAFDIFLMSEVAQPCSGVAIRGPIVAHESVDHNVELGLTPIVAFAWGRIEQLPRGAWSRAARRGPIRESQLKWRRSLIQIKAFEFDVRFGSKPDMTL
jgi:hypothetical protein